jgi:Raf kinase inhibitor-like YbhB/YbcL family protein
MPISTVAFPLSRNSSPLSAKSFCYLIVSASLLLSAASLLSQTAPTGGAATPFQLSSTSFAGSEGIPKQFSCEGSDASPPLSWKGVPSAAKSLALIMDDPDAPAGTWVHWVLYNLPASATDLAEGVEKQEQLANGTLQGRNSFGKVGYGGPCPPPGTPHRYFFKFYALDIKLDLKAGAGKDELEQAMKGHILGHAELIGTYRR